MKLLNLTSFRSTVLVTMLCCFSTGTAEQYSLLNTDVQPLSNKVCATCHGANGVGNPVVGGPSLGGLEPWYLKNQLMSFRAGYRGTDPDYIPGFEMQDSVNELSDAEIDELVAYISTWDQPVSLQTLGGDASHGSELYVTCAACHGVNAEGNPALNAPALSSRDDWYMLRQLKLFKAGSRGAHPDDHIGAPMRAAMSTLNSEQDMIDVLTFIKTLN